MNFARLAESFRFSCVIFRLRHDHTYIIIEYSYILHTKGSEKKIILSYQFRVAMMYESGRIFSKKNEV
jgi:hypothetical protein